ncbi:SLATT domain-containing protein [Sinorhizobium meliloti]|uniref:SLATT domain-containing protein n=1 Tax=Rhizobium meliloti TaxID=382 RepID=UPI0004044A64|nr:SLATT domain-containing protein [Sinorhizobium meliloti]
MGWRKDTTIPEDKFETALEYYASVRRGMREKANHNKLEAQGCFAAVIGCTLIAPLFVTLGEGPFLAKVVPSVLSVTAAGITSWLQLRKPQKLWVIYRRAQRELEEHKA